MSISEGILDLRELHSMQFKTALSTVVARIEEIFGITNDTSGARQVLRLRSQAGSIVELILYEQGDPVLQRYRGGYISITANPLSEGSLRWEQSKATSPKNPTGVLIARRGAKLQLYLPDHEQAIDTPLGCSISAGYLDRIEKEKNERRDRVCAPPAPSSPSPAAQPAAVAPPSAPTVEAPTIASPPVTPMEIQSVSITTINLLTQLYIQCLGAARALLGPKAIEQDVHSTANAVFQKSAELVGLKGPAHGLGGKIAA